MNWRCVTMGNKKFSNTDFVTASLIARMNLMRSDAHVSIKNYEKKKTLDDSIKFIWLSFQLTNYHKNSKIEKHEPYCPSRF